MRLDSLAINVPTAPATTPGVAQSVRDLREKSLQLIGPMTGSYDIECSLDGTHFAKTWTGITTDVIKGIPEACTHVRIVPTVNTVAPTAVLNGFNARTDGGG